MKVISSIVEKTNIALKKIKEGKDASSVIKSPVSFDMELPNVGIGVEGCWVEKEGSYLVDYMCSISVVAK